MDEITCKKAALTAGCPLVTMAMVAGVGYNYAFSGFYRAGDIAGTLGNLKMGGYSLLKVAVAACTIILILDIIIAWALYEFFKNSSQSLSLLVAIFRLVYAAIPGGSIFYLLSALELMQHVSKQVS